jgi:heme exporter protein A
MANSYIIEAQKLTKVFGQRLVFKNLDFRFENNGIYGIAGANGSGKSTLVKIIAGLLSPSAGKVSHSADEIAIKPAELHNYIGFAAPYLELYDEFTAWENLSLFSGIRGIAFDTVRAESLLKELNIYSRRNDYVKTYSSGMKQRLKFAFAFLHSPRAVILDEPISNLDSGGKEIVYEIIKKESRNSIVIIASNEENDLGLCSSVIVISDYKTETK